MTATAACQATLLSLVGTGAMQGIVHLRPELGKCRSRAVGGACRWHAVAMSDESPRKLAERLFAAIDKKDQATIDSLCADERLHEALGRFLTAFPDVRFRPGWIISENDMVAAWVEMEGTHGGLFRGVAPTGKHVQSAAIYALRVQHGKFVDYWLGADWLGMVDQIGALRIVDPTE